MPPSPNAIAEKARVSGQAHLSVVLVSISLLEYNNRVNGAAICYRGWLGSRIE
jgi:hypothetical protein